MALSVVDLYRDILPKTNCGECGFPTCLAFASMVVAEQHPLSGCPHLSPEVVEKCTKEMAEQYEKKQWTRRDMAEDAILWARERAASMKPEDLPERIGGELTEIEGETVLRLPYFTETVLIRPGKIVKGTGGELSRWEQIFLYNHLAQGGRRMPAGKWKALQEFPNTVSKIKSMRSHVEAPLIKRFSGKTGELAEAALAVGGQDEREKHPTADAAFLFTPLPRVPVLLLFWDSEGDEDFDATVKLLFDETVTEHLDIESILFLSERICGLLCGEEA